MMKKYYQKQYEAIKSQIEQVLLTTVQNCEYMNRAKVIDFETNLAKKIDVKNAITCNSVTDAMQMVLLSYGIGKGDAVFMSNLGTLEMANAVKLVGATPFFVEIQPETGYLHLAHLEAQIQKAMLECGLQPKMIVSSDHFGRPEEYLAINEVVRTYGLLLVEDCTKSLGGSYRGLNCGCFGHAAITSFAPGSPLSAMGNGAVILTDFNDLAGLLDTCGQKGKNVDEVESVGMDSVLDPLQAAILEVKLESFEKELTQTAKLAAIYDEALKEQFTLLETADGAIASNNEYVVLAKNAETADMVKAALASKGLSVETDSLMVMNKIAAFADEKFDESNETYKLTEEFAAKAVVLPIYPYMDVVEQDEIISVVLDAVE